MSQVGALQSRPERGPRCSAVVRSQKCIGVKRQHHQRSFLVLVIDRHIKNLLGLESEIGRSKRCAAVFADLNALALRSQNYPVRMLWIDDNRIDHPIARSNTLPA